MEIYSLLRKTPILRILLIYIIGILIANYFNQQLTNATSTIYITTIILFVLTILIHFNHKLVYLYDYFLIPTILCIAISLTSLSTKIPTNYENEQIWQGIIYEKPILKTNSILIPVKLSPKLFKSDKILKSQKLLLYTTKDSNLFNKIRIGDSIFFSAQLSKISNYGNPDEFNYANYMLNNGVSFQTYTPLKKIKIYKTKKLFTKRFLANIQSKAIKQFALSIKNKDAFAIVSALTLGNKHYLSDELKQSFANSGAIHVLAVSGLHIGIIYIFLNFLFGFMNKNIKQVVLKISLIIIFIWLYAILTGLSPSVLRAAIMFSLIGIGKTFKRDISIFNILASAALILLIANPLSLFNVGFQLSFLAVGGIVFFQPLLFNLISFRSRLLNKIYQLFTLTIAAQLVTAPITIYYFHQFPSYFWLTNILLIPLISTALISAIILLITSWIPYFTEVVSFTLELVLKITNNWVNFIDNLPYAVIENINLLFSGLLISYVLLAFTTSWILTKKAILLYISIITLIIGGFLSVKSELRHASPNKLIFYNFPHQDLIGIYSNNKSYLISIQDSLQNKKIIKSYFKPHWLKMKYTKKINISNLKSLAPITNTYNINTIYLNKILLPNNEELIIYNKNMKYIHKNLESDYLYICNNSWPPKTVIYTKTVLLSNTLDNYIKNTWKEYAAKNNLTTIDLNKSGAYIIYF